MEGAPHTAKTIVNMCVLGVPPSPVYKGARGGDRRPHRVRPKGGILLLLGVDSPFTSQTRRGRKEEEGEKESSPNADWAWGGASTWPAPPLFHKGP